MNTGSPMKELEKGLKELNGSATPSDEQHNQPTKLQNFQTLKHQPLSTHGETHGFSCICSKIALSGTNGRRGLWSRNLHFPSVGKCQGTEVDRLIGRGSTFMEASEGGGGMRVGVKQITFEL